MAGLDEEGWFGRHFEPWSLFGYIGDRTKVLEYQTTKSFVRRLAELLAPKISIVSLIGKLSGLNIGAGNSESEVANPDFSYYPEIGVIVQFYESHQILGAHARQRIGRAKNRLFPSGHEPNSCSTLISDSNSGYRRAIASDV